MKYDSFICEVVADGHITRADAASVGIPSEVYDLIEVSRLHGERVVNVSKQADGLRYRWAIAPFTTAPYAQVSIDTRSFELWV